MKQQGELKRHSVNKVKKEEQRMGDELRFWMTGYALPPLTPALLLLYLAAKLN